MILIPGILISVVTFPGVIVHELAHQLFCRLMRVPVYQVKYFQFKNPTGYVIHEASDRPLANFLIAVGPFLINTLVGICLLLPAAMEYVAFGGLTGSSGMESLLMVISMWLGLSVLIHAFPSRGDAKTLITTIMKNKEVPLMLRILVAPVVGLIYVGAIGSMVWLDLAYAVAIAALVPQILLRVL